MNKDFLKKATPYLVAVIVFLVITVVYFSPVLEGKKLKQHDIAMYKGMSKEIADFREKTGEEALWTNSMFGGMPAWQISVRYNGNLTSYIDKIVTLGLPYPVNYVFLYFLGFFILLLVLRVNPWVSLAGSIAFALSSYFFIILGAGHTSKAHAIGYMAPVLAGIILAYRGKSWQGALLFATALALEINAGHLQITYYLLIIIAVYGIYKLIEAIMEKQLPGFIKASGLLIVAALLAVLTHSTNLWATYDYGKDTMRGKPELTKNLENKSGGLDRDYITTWSYGIGETWSFLIPNAKGGASGLIGNHKALDKADARYRSTIAQQGSAYWGDQPGTSGPVYIGVIVLFLFFLGMFIITDRLKWVLFVVTVLSILLAWGRNFMPFTDFFIDYIPGYNKFRAVSMTLVIAELAIPILAFIALDKLISDPAILKKNMKWLYISFGLTGGLIILFYLLPSTFFNFLNQAEQQFFSELPNTNEGNQIAEIFANIELVRIAIFRADALRSLLFVTLGAALVIAFLFGRIKKGWLITGIALLILMDMATLNKRYLNNDNFVRARQVDVPFQASMANNEIFKDSDPDFRVLDLTHSTFNDASCSYFHKSIGGYHGAKLQRYQDLIDEYISKEMMDLGTAFQNAASQYSIDNALKKQQVLNMLNMKYIIVNPGAPPVSNTHAFGHAWFVDEYMMVKNADEEIVAIGENNLRTSAIIDERFSEQVAGKNFTRDPIGLISLKSYAPNHLVYDVDASTEKLAVFSEIYYDKGWNAYLDGEPVPHFRTNYILRSMVVPAGKHKVEFKFEPKVWIVGEKVSFASSLLLILLIIGGLWYSFSQWRSKGQTTSADNV